MERGEESRECKKGLDSLRMLPPMAVHLCGIFCECECVEETTLQKCLQLSGRFGKIPWQMGHQVFLAPEAGPSGGGKT